MTAVEKIKAIQQILGVTVDGDIGPHTRAAFDDLDVAGNLELSYSVLTYGEVSVSASSFADPADLAAFRRCKASGKTDVQCFAVGDNGIGQSGKITAQDHTPMVALPGPTMVAKWGSLREAWGHEVIVTVPGHEPFRASVEDRISAPGRIDLNPACLKVLGLSAPILISGVTWRWA